MRQRAVKHTTKHESSMHMSQLPQTKQEALAALRNGQPVVFPTDTLFGLGVSVLHAPSPEILYAIKQREKKKPVAWLVSSIDDLQKYGKAVPEFALALARTFWPGPLTIIVKASDEVPEAFRSAEGTIGLRMPANPTAHALIEELGCPIATTSANLSGQKNTVVFDQIDPSVLGAVAAAITDDEEKSGVASTIVDCSLGDHPVLTREGIITIAQIQALA